jgi:hypothetical protein
MHPSRRKRYTVAIIVSNTAVSTDPREQSVAVSPAALELPPTTSVSVTW